jgi:DNA-binding FrmR family transcriptional regulator
MPGANQKGLCFVIAPIGEEGSETRTRSDQVLNHVIAPAATECGYEALRADKISEPGIITSQVIQHLVDDPLVIADLSGWNPNVFYELAVRHAVRKPVVQIIQAGERIPFDVAGTRTIALDHRDLDSAARCRDDIVRQIRAVEKDVSQVDTPISAAIDLQSLRGSENPLEKSNAEIISMLQDVRGVVLDLAKGAAPGPAIDLRVLGELTYTLATLGDVLTPGTGEEGHSERLEEGQRYVQRAMRLVHMLGAQPGTSPSAPERAYTEWRRLIEAQLGRPPGRPPASAP